MGGVGQHPGELSVRRPIPETSYPRGTETATTAPAGAAVIVGKSGLSGGMQQRVEVPLGADRDQLTTKAAQTFLDCRSQVLSAIIGQSPPNR